MAPNAPRAPSKFFQEDLVRRKRASHDLGVVMRCWHDSEDFPIIPNPLDPLLRPLEPGEIGVSFLPNHRREILKESEFVLVDRAFQPGDACKKDLKSVEAGVVISVEVEAKLEHTITGAKLEGWIPSNELEVSNDLYIGDFVTIDDWIGQVEEIFDEAIVQLTAGGLVRVPQLGARLQVGDSGIDILPPPAESTSLFSPFIRNSPQPGERDTVLTVKPTVIAVNWLAINQMLEPAEAAKRQRPARFWSGGEMSRLKLIRGFFDNKARAGDKYVLKNPSIATAQSIQPSSHGYEGIDGGKIDVFVFMARETRSRVTVLWQNGTTEEIDSKQLIPYLNVDEYDCWPGDYVLHKTEESNRIAIVQQVNSTERTALLRYVDNGSTELVSLLELDLHGTSGEGNTPDSSYDGFGVRRGDFVFIHREGTTNGSVLPKVPKIGEPEPWVREMPHMVQNPDGTTALGGWRGDLHNIGQNIAKIRGTPEALGLELDGKVQKMTKEHGIDWFGEVIALRTDGLVDVLLGNGESRVFPLDRLTRLTDPMEQPIDMWGEEYDEGYGQGEEDGEETMEIRYENNAESAWVPYDPEVEMNDEWEDVIDDWSSVNADVGMTTDIPGVESENDTDADLMDVDRSQVFAFDPPITKGVQQQVPITPPPSHSPPPTSAIASPSEPPSVNQPAQIVTPSIKTSKDISQEDEESHWQRFAILSQAPVDHAFYSSKPAQTTKAFMTRLNKEYRVLKSTLPDSILIRAYEDRVDLLRCLIIGPENTPYQDAPFVIDWLLDSDFPQSPPQAHFLSWTNGNGRVNPNLYEEGKVCLSILGTWAGDRNESWSAARSSLLQAFVSIQGLVLVKEPWFCEPAYEKLRNTEEGVVNSRLYSEKAYVLSRGFVRRALEIPLGGLEEEIKWFYLERGTLKDIIDEARRLIEQSKAAEGRLDSPTPSSSFDSNDRAVPKLTTGGALLLSRTLAKLDALWEARTSGASNLGA